MIIQHFNELNHSNSIVNLILFFCFKKEQQINLENLRAAIAAEQHRMETLHLHIMELGDMRHNDNNNMSQRLSDMEERMEYRVEEHMRDLHELLERCQTRVCAI